MKLKRKLAKKLAVISLVFTLALSQSGCLVGIVFWPLWIVGSVIGAGGIGLTIGGAVLRDVGLMGGGIGLIILGSVLDTENPGRADALNELSLDNKIAEDVNVSIRDIKSYNQNLDKIRAVGLELGEDIRQQIKRKDELSRYTRSEDLYRDPQIDRLAVKYGFESGENFFKSFHSKKLPAQNVKAFAEKMDLTEGQAKLLLYYGFAVASE